MASAAAFRLTLVAGPASCDSPIGVLSCPGGHFLAMSKAGRWCRPGQVVPLVAFLPPNSIRLKLSHGSVDMEVSAVKSSSYAHRFQLPIRRQFANVLAAAGIAVGQVCFWTSSSTLADSPQPLSDPPALQADIPAEDTSDAAAGSTAEPYVVFVAEAKAFTRCGPAQTHYRTDPLRLGQELEVYVETSDGWLGVRPTDDSFCWISGDSVRLDSNGQVATVLKDKTIAWIGTNLGQAKRYRWQVQLQSGEEVTVIEVTDGESEAGGKSWLRIVPPSGEFRWVHRDQVADSAESLAAAIAKRATQTKVATKSLPQPVRQAAEVKAAEPKTATLEAGSDDREYARGEQKRQSASESDNPGLKLASDVPELRPVRKLSAMETASREASPKTVVKDRAIQFHRNAPAEEFEDRGAVIGSGLKKNWSQPSGDEVAAALDFDGDSTSVLSDEPLSESPAVPSANGAAAAVSAIATPLRKVSDVVANFISPPRIVQIDARDQGSLDLQPARDTQWTSGQQRLAQGNLDLPAVGQQWQIEPGRRSPVEPNYLPPQSLSSLGQPQVSQVGAVNENAAIVRAGGSGWGQAVASSSVATRKGVREVRVSQIARVSDAMRTANVDEVDRWLSKLIAETASADEMDPLIHRADELLRTGVIASANRTRELLSRAREYRYVAARRDGPTIVRDDGTGLQRQPVATASPLVVPASAAMPLKELPSSELPAGLSPTPSHSTADSFSTGGQQVPDASAVTSKSQPAEHATGFLVQVYSSRPNSPPYALTDEAGVTIAYVTPYPGINLRTHLNSRVAVQGQQKYLEGMNTPHYLVDQVLRR